MVKIELLMHDETSEQLLAQEPDWAAATRRLEEIIGSPLPSEQAVATSTSPESWSRNLKQSKYSVGDRVYLLTGPFPLSDPAN